MRTTKTRSYSSFGRPVNISVPVEVTDEDVLAFKNYKQNQILEEYINKFGGNKMEDEILRWECEICGKKLKSLYQGQLDHWVKQHMLTHED